MYDFEKKLKLSKLFQIMIDQMINPQMILQFLLVLQKVSASLSFSDKKRPLQN